MQTPEHLEDDEFADAVFDFVQSKWLADDELYDGWEDELVGRLNSLLDGDFPEESDVWEMLDDMGLTIGNNPFEVTSSAED